MAESINVEDSSGSKANVALIRNLQLAGYKIKVYHYTRKEIELEGIECINIPEKRWTLLFFLSRAERYIRNLFKIRLHAFIERFFGFSFTLLNDRNSIVRALKKIPNFEPDLVVTLSKGGSFRPHHALLELPDFHSKWIAYIHDPYPMHWYPPPYPWYEPGYRQKEDFMKQVADDCFRAAFPSQLLLEWMGDKYEPFRKKGIVIPHQINTTEITPVNTSALELDPLKFNIIHAGNLLRGREPYGLLKGFDLFLQNNPKAREFAALVFIGGHNYYSEHLINFEIKTKQFKWSRKKLDFDSVQYLQHQASVNVILEAKSEISPFLPGKFPHCITANKPILLLGPPKSESRRLLGQDYAYWAEIDDAQKICLLLEELFNKWEDSQEDLILDRQDLEDYLSISHLSNVLNSDSKNL